METFSSLGETASLGSGETLFSAGALCQNIYVIISGRVKCQAEGKADIEREAGDVLCLIDALAGTTCSRSCSALEDVELLVIPTQALTSMLEAADNVMAMTMKASAVRVALAQEGAPA
ncbi:MAG TPA: hypothetical protein DD668_06930 [Alphaproteobacteria bacterium]|jgi:CRP-like cAMP-binding protein|nr:hypothetical protein [Rhodospirillaceae bacterium]HBP59299.1 hypothetical protein [Alphaproteobacteria bacterium]HCA14935.1 hypothetical protein [Alphaproteobacteria bacterium]HCD79660.1 hypothetical protein [Alphaproteobacteria bacterium]|tara:strand:+ start:48 stop:401 length:354 start_codon:yes stop_codon:yes gene_type:complete